MADSSKLFEKGCEELETVIAVLAEWADEEEDRTEDGGSAKQILSLRDRLSSTLGTFVKMNDALADTLETVKFDNPVEEGGDGDEPSADAGSLFVSEAGKLQRLRSIQMMEAAMKDKVPLPHRLVDNTVMFLGGPGLQSRTSAILWAAAAFVGGMSGVYTVGEYLREYDTARPPVDPRFGIAKVGEGGQLEAAANVLLVSGAVLVGLIAFSMYQLWTLSVDLFDPAEDVFNQ
jgi:hypothetical protein